MNRPGLFSLSMLALAALLAPPATAQTVVRPEAASAYVGRAVLTEGTVVGVGFSRRSSTTFLNFCAPYPDQCLTAVIFRSAQPFFPDAQAWEGQRVRVSGTVKLYRGKPEIILETPRQIRGISR